MLLRYLLSALFITLLSTSCISNKQLLGIYKKSSSYQGFAKKLTINGTYQNDGTNSNKPNWRCSQDLFAQLATREKNRIDHRLVQQISLLYDGKNQLLIGLHFADGSKVARRIRVANKGNYLSLKRSYFLIPIPLLFYVEKEQRTLLLRDAKGQLVSVCRSRDWGNALIILGGSHDNRAATVVPGVAR